MRTWQLQEAKQKFSELVNRALDEGPQTITRRGEEVAVLVSRAEYRRMADRKPSFKEVLLGPPYSDDLAEELERIVQSREHAREIDFPWLEGLPEEEGGAQPHDR